jgi:hypothetical protein
MFYRLAMRSIQAWAGISTDTDKINARGQCWSSRFSVSERNKLKLELQRARGPMSRQERKLFGYSGWIRASIFEDKYREI